jgi:hypothetical protein
MSNEVVKPVFGGGVSMANPEALVNALENSVSNDPRGGSANGCEFLNFSGKGGRYEIGKDKDPMDPSELWVIDVTRFEDGWICWKNNKPVATRLYPLGQPVPTPDMNEHGPFDRDMDGWYQAKAMVARSVDTGRQVYFKNNSVSGVSEFAGLQKQVVERLKTGQPAWPVIMFKMEGFEAKGFKNYKPIFEVDGWLGNEQLEPLLAAMESGADFSIEDFYEAANGPAEKKEEPKTIGRRKRV